MDSKEDDTQGEIRISRREVLEEGQAVIDRMYLKLNEIAGDGRLDTMTETEFETGDCIVRWFRR